MSASGNPQVMNQEFHALLHLFNKYLSNLTTERKSRTFRSIIAQLNAFVNIGDRQVSAQWINKLKDFNARIQDLKMRNKIVAALIMQMQLGVLQAPFNQRPRFTSLDQVQPIPEMTADNVFPTNFKLPFMMANSPDQGAFLVSQPVPKCGAFCYVAVVSRPPNN